MADASALPGLPALQRFWADISKSGDGRVIFRPQSISHNYSAGRLGGPGGTVMSPRRLAAILAADIAGYSALMGSDEARTVSDLKGHQAVVLPMVGDFGG